MTRTGAAVLLTLTLALGACGSGNGSVDSVRAELSELQSSHSVLQAEREDLVKSYNDRIEELDAATVALEGSQSELEAQRAESSATLVKAEESRDEAVSAARSEAARAATEQDLAHEGELAERDSQISALLLAYDDDIADTRALIVDQGPSVACSTAIADADEEIRPLKRAEWPLRLVDELDSTGNIAIFLDLAADQDEIVDPMFESYLACYEQRQGEIEAERLEAERRELAAVLPYLCTFQTHQGYAKNASGTTLHLSELVSYLRRTFPGVDDLPDEWQTTTAVQDELERCAALPAMVLGEGLFEVGFDIAAGTYRSIEGVFGSCYWARYSANGSIRANDFIVSAKQVTIAVRSSDYTVENDCGTMIAGTLRRAVTRQHEVTYITSSGSTAISVDVLYEDAGGTTVEVSGVPSNASYTVTLVDDQRALVRVNFDEDVPMQCEIHVDGRMVDQSDLVINARPKDWVLCSATVGVD